MASLRSFVADAPFLSRISCSSCESERLATHSSYSLIEVPETLRTSSLGNDPRIPLMRTPPLQALDRPLKAPPTACSGRRHSSYSGTKRAVLACLERSAARRTLRTSRPRPTFHRITSKIRAQKFRAMPVVIRTATTIMRRSNHSEISFGLTEATANGRTCFRLPHPVDGWKF